MNEALMPETMAAFADAVRSVDHVLVTGGGTKPRLSRRAQPPVNAEQSGSGSGLAWTRISTRHLSGMQEYDPGEFTFTALAGTPIKTIAVVLAGQGQYLPFDPMLLESGATLGGTVASGLSGPGRFRYGGVRDFILGLRVVDGRGRILRFGGRVVKNAAGFDLPKFLVGSRGCYSAIVEATFKVFPCPSSSATLRLHAAGPPDTLRLLTGLGRARHEFDAVEVAPGSHDVVVRLRAPEPALTALIADVLTLWPGHQLDDETASGLWSSLREWRWVPLDAGLVKVPVTLDTLALWLGEIDPAKRQVTAGGQGVYLSVDDPGTWATLDYRLKQLNLTGLTLRGGGPLGLGVRSAQHIEEAVKAALDPDCKFPGLYD